MNLIVFENKQYLPRIWRDIKITFLLAFALYGEFPALTVSTYFASIVLMHVGFIKCAFFLFALTSAALICNKVARDRNL